MSILQMPLASVMAWLLALAFAGAGFFNAIGGPAVKAEFVSWGYPSWWNLVTAAVELLSAALIVFPDTRMGGLALATAVLVAALATVIWRRAYQHLPPGLALAALVGVEFALVVGR
jgi:hypothetical protein